MLLNKLQQLRQRGPTMTCGDQPYGMRLGVSQSGRTRSLLLVSQPSGWAAMSPLQENAIQRRPLLECAFLLAYNDGDDHDDDVVWRLTKLGQCQCKFVPVVLNHTWS